MSGFYLALDRCYRDQQKESFLWEGDRNHVEGLMWTPTYEHYYWNGEERTWHGAVEKATEYPAKEGAEGQSIYAMALDAEVAGHMHVVSALEAFRREQHNMKARKHAEEEKKRWDATKYKLGPGEGGLI